MNDKILELLEAMDSATLTKARDLLRDQAEKIKPTTDEQSQGVMGMLNETTDGAKFMDSEACDIVVGGIAKAVKVVGMLTEGKPGTGIDTCAAHVEFLQSFSRLCTAWQIHNAAEAAKPK